MARQTTLNAQIDAYYSTLDELAKQYATHEGAVSVAFQIALGRYRPAAPLDADSAA